MNATVFPLELPTMCTYSKTFSVCMLMNTVFLYTYKSSATVQTE